MTTVTTTTTGAEWFTQPFDGLELGMSLRTRGRTITEADIVAFAGLTGDFNPLHVDAHAAEHGPYRGRVAHGMLVISYAIGLLPVESNESLALRGLKDVVFKRPARIGDSIYVEAKLVEHSEISDDLGLVGLGLTIVDQDGGLLMRATIRVLWPRRR